MRGKIAAFFYSFTLVLVWWVGLIDIQADQVTAGLSLLFTFVATFFVSQKLELDFYGKLIILFFPTLYFFSYAYIWEAFGVNLLIFPLSIGLIFLIGSLNCLKDLTKLENLFLFLFCTVLYTYRFYPVWSNERNPSQIENFAEQFDPKTQHKLIRDSINLENFKFINTKKDSVSIFPSQKYVLLETWNESCPPCLKAFKELHPFYTKNKSVLQTYYVYENSKANARNNFDRVFNFKPIIDKSRIIIDINQEFYQNADMKGFPYFLLFNPKGELVFSQRGYQSETRVELERRIEDLVTVSSKVSD